MAMIVMLSVPRTAKCTAGPTAVEGERCGRPAVAGFVVGSRHYYECELHAAPGFPTRHPDEKGAP